MVVESEEVKAPDGQPAVLMVQKRDGGYGYDTTDLATLRYRVRDLKADRILYVVDARQALHFRLIFEAARRMGWLPARVSRPCTSRSAPCSGRTGGRSRRARAAPCG